MRLSLFRSAFTSAAAWASPEGSPATIISFGTGG
jgi:hypothetical protein